MSAKTGRAPRNTYALTPETNVNDGTMTSSPGFRSRRSADISSACVHDVVRRTFFAPRSCSSIACARFVKAPSPEMCPFAIDCATYSSSRPSTDGLLKGIIRSNCSVNAVVHSIVVKGPVLIERHDPSDLAALEEAWSNEATFAFIAEKSGVTAEWIAEAVASLPDHLRRN